MADNMKKLNLDDLENAAGGRFRTVNTHTTANAVVRSGPGTSFEQILSLPNGSEVNTTGEVMESFVDGRTWYEIDYPIDGWIAGSLIGYSG